MAEQKSSSALTAPLHGAASVLRRVPGAGMVSRAAEGTLDKVGAVSPRGRRIAVYAGAGVLGAAGVVEWPVALTGAAVAWLTQPRPAHPAERESAAWQGPEPAHDLGTAALRSGHGTGSRNAGGTSGAASAGVRGTAGGTDPAASVEDGTEAAGDTEATSGARSGAGAAAAGGAGASAGDAASGGGGSHGGGGSPGSARVSHGAGASAGEAASGGGRSHDGGGSSGRARTSRGAEGSAVKPSTGPLGPTARPDRTTL
ncbi:hypothetical protein [Streptomyces sp. NPDC053069]|uniref:hypothetical protein n=1 Tax=Streptomyces sp. NPDC053069 TaxID=3365695 RepID=UPI0037CF460F